MPDRTIEYTVKTDRISPVTVQNGGVSGDECTVEVVFDVSALSIDSTNRIRVDVTDGAGGFYSSENLTVNNGKVSFMLPAQVTLAGGIAQLHLVVTRLENGAVSSMFHSYPARIRFEASPDVTEGYLHYEHGLSGLAAECANYAGAAKKESENFSGKLEAHKADVEKKIGEVTDTLTANLTNHNESATAHESIRTSISTLHDTVDENWNDYLANKTAVQGQIGEVTDALTANLTNHNSSATAHESIRTSISTLHDTVDENWNDYLANKVSTAAALGNKADYSTGTFTLTSMSDSSFTLNMEYIRINSLVLIYGSFNIDDPSDLNMQYSGLPFNARERSGMASSAIRFYANQDKLIIAANDTIRGTIYLTYLTDEQ